ncbi:hypothetical protein KBX37_08330 [Micromonospora sp. U56]|uniref:hypothetical protein n=1 Tax=Micromonospora sp. U56 TaxID=2824900 RepID=UPI001B375A7A|nr:hypothetical protein [Micromonospora sp. U56]MBQ0893105.1 hypothetical protein [Micromonospora sp. U56]
MPLIWLGLNCTPSGCSGTVTVALIMSVKWSVSEVTVWLTSSTDTRSRTCQQVCTSSKKYV